MQTTDFTQSADIVNIIDDLKQYFSKKPFIVSDVIDDKGNQYIDLVQEGGGVLGIALLGYTYVLEQMGIRFLSLGGTSAGAINTLLLAACDLPQNEKSVRILDILANKNLYDFVDGDEDAREFIDALLDEDTKLWKMGLKALQVIDNFKEDMSLNPGDSFHQWMVSVLDGFGIYDTAGLLERIEKLPDSIQFRKDSKGNSLHANREVSNSLAIVAAEVNTETKVVFPAMRNLFYKNIDKPNPADYVRASMSIPIFYKPFELTDLPNDKEAILNWKRIAEHRGEIPPKAMFVDGGIMSNFPIDVFHRLGGIPSRPTFGVKLGLERVSNNDVKNIGQLLFGCFDAARNLRDFEFINKNPDFKNLLAYINTKDYNWLNFNVSDEMKLDLFKAGAKEAKTFLEKFNWQQYKEIRRSIRSTNNTDEAVTVLSDTIHEIIEEKEQKTTESDIQALSDRLYYLGKVINLNALWIDDNPEFVTKERLLLEKIGVTSTLVSSTDAARDYIKNNSGNVDLIISDISRNENYAEGVEFTEWLFKTNPGFNKKVIFYIFDVDLSKGVPPYAFGITNLVVELIHLIIDLAQRRD